MIQLRILTGNAAGKLFLGQAFPVSFGRASNNQLVLQEPGVFDRHFDIRFTREGYKLTPSPHAPVTINDTPSLGVILRSGDIIKAGAAKLEFSLGPAQQKGLALREGLTWALVFLIACGQVACIAWLLGFSRF